MNDSSADIRRLSGIPRDTTPDAFWAQCAALRRLGTSGRLRMAFDLTEQVWRTVADGIRHRHPFYSAEEIRLAMIRIRLGETMFRIGYPDATVLP